MPIEMPKGHSHKDIWEREELFLRTKEHAQMRDVLAPIYHHVATAHLSLPWQLMSAVNAEGFALRLRWSQDTLPDPHDEGADTDIPPYSFLEVNSNCGVNLLQFLRRKPSGAMYMQQLSPGAIYPNIPRIQKALVKDLQRPYSSTDIAPAGWVADETMSLWVPESSK